MDANERSAGNGAPHAGPGIGERVDQLNENAQKLLSDAQDAVSELADAVDLRGRVQRHPYGMLAAAAGVGYVLGGGLFTPFTARVLRLAVRLAALPLVKDELIGMAEAAVDNLASRTPGRGAPSAPKPGGGDT
jgi:hypothetical protein